ncbi:NAD(P)/FAD-dependent oxidoreductase [Algicella marina]|uniref:FAD-dependent oxidoreductase n=1 Tax=Algicella marina TaxID=2683284 RepID=A0A6P1T4B6_9RHOB|nr:FAD-dependent oxidoreductase [Algicella marina]QHQ36336.1 FAD-dependent oxidoreductase [Algicella marina]
MSEFVIVGAGIVGVSTAIWLQRAGHSVTLVDRIGPAGGTSHGNGGVLASCAIVPVTGPGLIAKAPSMLLDRRQPLYLKWPYLPFLLPWLAKYLAHANEADTRRIAAALAPIIGESLADHQALAAGTGAERWLVPGDYLYVYGSRSQFEADALTWEIRRAHGFTWEELEGPAFSAYDPAFAPEKGFAVRMSDHGRITDPGAYVQALAAHVKRQGGRILKGDVTDFVRENGRVTGVHISGTTLPADKVVITTGAWSKPLAARLGLSIPLESERGYHLELWEPSVMPRAPVMIASGKFVATPMEGRLRLAGILEFGGLHARPSRAPFKLLKNHARAAFPGLTWQREVEWMGHRPALPDSIPIIGEAPAAPGVFLGLGHHHVGLTGGPRTGQLLAGLATDTKPNIDLSPYSPSRFVK